MDIGLILGLIKVALEVFKDERKDRFLRQYLDLEVEYHNEISKPDFNESEMKGKKYNAKNYRDDLTLDSILLKCESLARVVIRESSASK